MPTIEALPILSDNYVWLLHDRGQALVVDPGEASAVRHRLQQLKVSLAGILVTHHHSDHIGGIAELTAVGSVPVYGPRSERARIPLIDHPVDDGQTLATALGAIDVIAVPGHTLGHVAYRCGDALFCGDTLFSAGCGRMFEGEPGQYLQSIKRLADLPDTTRICCAHEYSLANLAFALAVEPGNADAQAHLTTVRSLRAKHAPSLPSSLALERRINPFLRTAESTVRLAAQRYRGHALGGESDVFAALREWKNGFSG